MRCSAHILEHCLPESLRKCPHLPSSPSRFAWMGSARGAISWPLFIKSQGHPPFSDSQIPLPCSESKISPSSAPGLPRLPSGRHQCLLYSEGCGVPTLLSRRRLPALYTASREESLFSQKNDILFPRLR